MSQETAKNVRLCVPADAAFARSVRMCASSLAVVCDMSVDDVEDVRMVAEEGFVYACATAPAEVSVDFSLSGEGVAMDFSLGPVEPADDFVELVEMLLDAVCDEFGVTGDGSVLHLVKRTGGEHDNE